MSCSYATEYWCDECNDPTFLWTGTACEASVVECMDNCDVCTVPDFCDFCSAGYLFDITSMTCEMDMTCPVG